MDYEPEFKREFDTGIIVSINKTGGGTPGKSYVGTWDFEVMFNSVSLYQGQLETGSPKTHEDAADVAHYMVLTSRSFIEGGLH